MRPGPLTLLPAWVGLAALSGCNWLTSSSEGGGSGAPAAVAGSAGGGSLAPSGFGGVSPVAGTDDQVVATAATDHVSVVVGASRTLSITFTSSDGRAMSGFQISGTLGALPAGWRGPNTFSCATLGAGNGCVLDLTYAPTAIDQGSFSVGYVVIDNAGLPRTDGVVTVNYEATPSNHVLAAAAPAGQINAQVGAGPSVVGIAFFTDDGNPATQLTLTTDLTRLPPGWSTAESAWSCAVVSTGSGCELMLSFAPTAQSAGTLTLAYTYLDEAGAAQNAAMNLAYSSTSANQVIAAAAPAGQIVAVQKAGGQAVPVTFTTDDGKPATHLAVTSDLNSLPAGWSSAVPNFSCATASTGNGCRLPLTFAPGTLVSGVLSLRYAYVDGAGGARTGLLDLPYAATTNDNVVGTASPAGQVNAVVGTGAVPVSVTFSTDDGRAATALTVNGSLGTLPAGWSSTQSSFACPAVDGVSACAVPLTYAPTAAGSGTLTLTYAYDNNAGEAKTGTVNIPYRATTDDNIVAAYPATLAVATGSSTPLSITFTTDDGDAAGNLSASAGLGLLPANWSGASSFECATVSAGTACVLTLTYAPMSDETGTLTLPYSYVNDSGFARSGTVSVAYSASPPPP